MNKHYPLPSTMHPLFSPARRAGASGWFSFLLRLSLAMMCGLFPFISLARAETFCIDYQYFPNTNNLRVFDFTILSPYCEVDLTAAHSAGKKAYAYISAGEVAANAQYYQAAQAAGIPFIGQNPNWNSMLVDLSSSRWAPFVIQQLALPAVNKGYDGFFLDTMDSYYLANPLLEAAQETGLVNLVKALKAAYPTKQIITNRGFPVFNRLTNEISGMLVEGLYYTYPGAPQTVDGTTWLLAQIAPVRAAGKPVYIVDYLSPALSAMAVPTAQRISQLGLTPMISPPDLDGTVLAPSPAPRIEKFAIKLGLPTVTFTALPGKAYALESSDSLQGSHWSKVKDVPLQTITSLVDVKDTSATAVPGRFYRIVAR